MGGEHARVTSGSVETGRAMIARARAELGANHGNNLYVCSPCAIQRACMVLGSVSH